MQNQRNFKNTKNIDSVDYTSIANCYKHLFKHILYERYFKILEFMDDNYNIKF